MDGTPKGLAEVTWEVVRCVNASDEWDGTCVRLGEGRIMLVDVDGGVWLMSLVKAHVQAAGQDGPG